ncbi:metallophosphoesterase [Candidatus Pacearchaeota archaeon]|nr:metallophosphoesterase [Candidatus Pacearchaeota archaeon]
MIRYIGKCLLIEEEEVEKSKKNKKVERVLVVGDIHFGSVGGVGGIDLNRQKYDEMISELEVVFEKIGKIDKVIILGDLKDEFSSLLKEERYGIVNLFDYLEGKRSEIVVVRGNHDNFLLNIIGKRGYDLKNFYIWRRYCFLHGDSDYKEIYNKEIKVWMMGHLHPAINLREGIKEERYKCFLEGEFKGKKIIILPSFIDVNEGIDVLNFRFEGNLPWKFNFKKFKVRVIGEKEEVFDFGILGRLWKRMNYGEKIQ